MTTTLRKDDESVLTNHVEAERKFDEQTEVLETSKMAEDIKNYSTFFQKEEASLNLTLNDKDDVTPKRLNTSVKSPFALDSNAQN